jgi:hypothetical protein
MLKGLLPDNLPNIEVPAEMVKPLRRSLAALPDPEPLPPELIERDAERARAVAAASGFGQSHSPAPKPKVVAAKTTPMPKPQPEPAVLERLVPDTGRMMRRSRQTELMSTRVTPETLKFLRDYANENDLTFSNLVEQVVREFRQSKGR